MPEVSDVLELFTVVSFAEEAALKQAPAIHHASIILLQNLFALVFEDIHWHGASPSAEIVDELPLDYSLSREHVMEKP